MFASLRRGLSRSFFLPLVVAALILLPARSARADDAGGWAAGIYYVAIVTLGLGVVGGDLAFTIHDAVISGESKPSTKGWAVGEMLFTAPQALYFNGALAWVHGIGAIDEAPRVNLMILPAIWTSQMATHGIWSLALNQEKPSYLYGFSWAIGANLTFTSCAVGGAFGKRLGGTVLGLSELAGTAPTIIVGLLQLNKDTLPDRAAWTALTAWSGALFLHGAASTVVGLVSPPKPRNDDPQPTTNTSQFVLTPTLIPNGQRNVPGLVAGGIF